MGRMINKKIYMEKLIEVLDETYPNTDYRKMSRYGITNKVDEQMSKYVVKTFGHSCDGIQLKDLIIESKALFEECLEELGITK
ncbi:MAG: hypothetical protein ACI4II_00285 [Acutalibacteraceae bacterium]